MHPRKVFKLTILLILVFAIYICTNVDLKLGFSRVVRPPVSVSTVGDLRNKVCQKIFFFTITTETKLSPVRSCAIISAARLNPQHCVIYLAPNTDRSQFHTTNIPRNVHIYYLNVQEWMSGTPLYDWFRKNETKLSTHYLYHLSDGLRFAILYHIGGIYLDTDVISLKPLDNETLGFGGAAVWESTNYLASCVLKFPTFSPFLQEVMQKFVDEFNANWGHQGPSLITRVYLDRKKKFNEDFTPADSSLAFPIPYGAYQNYFNKRNSQGVWINAQNSTFAHIWMAMWKLGNTTATIENGSFVNDLLNSPRCK